MFVTKKHLSRRTVLRGVGATVALPLLDAMVPARTALAQTAAKPVPRLGFVYFPHGAIMSKWTPTADGKDFELAPILAPLDAVQEAAHDRERAREQARGRSRRTRSRRARGCRACSPRISHDPYGGMTADQVAAQHIGQDTPLPSLEVSTEEPVGGGACDRNYGCSYGATISFRTPSTPLPMEFNPRKLFQRLFGQGDTPEERKALARAVLEHARRRRRQGGSACRRRVGRVRPRDARRLSRQRARDRAARAEDGGQRSVAASSCPTRRSAFRTSFDEQLNLMFDTDRARLAGEPHARHDVHDGGRGQQHDLQPHRRAGCVPRAVASSEQRRRSIERLQQGADLHTQGVRASSCKKLAEMPDGDGSMLDHSILLYGSNMSNSNAHDHFPLPDGRARRRLRQARGRPARALSGSHAGLESRADRAEPRRRAGRVARRQHRRDRGGLMRRALTQVSRRASGRAARSALLAGELSAVSRSALAGGRAPLRRTRPRLADHAKPRRSPRC